MKSAPSLFARFGKLAAVSAVSLAITGTANAVVTLIANEWVATGGASVNANVKVTGTLIAEGLLDATTITATSLTATGAITTTGAISSAGQLWAKSTLLVTGASTLTGNTTTQGDLSVYKGIDLGRSVGNPALSALQMDYYITGPSVRTASFDLTDSLGIFRWQDNIGATPRTKMLLDASNVLTLFNTTGSAAVTITPATGKIDLMGATGAGIYSNNVPVVAVGAAGATSVSTSSLNVSGATTVNTLSTSGAATLNSLTVTGATNLSGSVSLASPQGDISMGMYAE